jgi:hypothetical protein
MPLPKYIVRLTDEERTRLDDLIRTGKRAASVLIHARILLKADAGRTGRAGTTGGSPRRWSAGVHGVPGAPGVRGGRAGGGAVPQEADGPAVSQARWRPGGPPDRAGLRRAARRAEPVDDAVAGRPLVELEVVDTISPECVRTTLKKTSSSRGCASNG